MHSSSVFIIWSALLVVALTDELTDSQSCVSNATRADDCVAHGSPLMQKAVAKGISRHEDKRGSIVIESFVLDDQAKRPQWEAFWDWNVTALTIYDPIRPDDRMLNDSLNDGTISRRYKSWYMPDGPSGPEDYKFYHEVGVSMAHRNAWQSFATGANGDRNRWGLFMEADATLRADFWKWMRHLKEEVLNKENAPMMIWLGHCYERCYKTGGEGWRDGDFCLKGDGTDKISNPHNLSGCMVHFSNAICPTAYLLSPAGATKLLELTHGLDCAIDEKLRYEIQKNNLDARIMCYQLARQPWQYELYDVFDTYAAGQGSGFSVLVDKGKRKGKREGKREEKRSQRVHGVQDPLDPGQSICAPPGPNVRTLLRWPPVTEGWSRL